MIRIALGCTVALSIMGAILNARLQKEGFYLWLIANTVFIIHNVRIEEYAQAVLWIVYQGISIYGLWTWNRKQT